MKNKILGLTLSVVIVTNLLHVSANAPQAQTWPLAETDIQMSDSSDYSLYKTTMDEAMAVGKNLSTSEVTYYNVNPPHISEYNVENIISYSPPYNPTATNSSEIKDITEDEFLPTGIIGSDNRTQVTDTTQFPYSAIAYIEIGWPNGNYSMGTAWMLSANVAVTAGHCLYMEEYGGWAENVNIWPGNNGALEPYGYAQSTMLYVATEWKSSANTNYDWGLIVLDRDIGEETGWLGISSASGDLSNNTLITIPVTISGYPKDHQFYQYEMSGSILSSNTKLLYYQIDTYEGQSGAPIYTVANYALGIHTNGPGGINYGSRITTDMYNFFMSFRE